MCLCMCAHTHAHTCQVVCLEFRAQLVGVSCLSLHIGSGDFMQTIRLDSKCSTHWDSLLAHEYYFNSISPRIGLVHGTDYWNTTINLSKPHKKQKNSKPSNKRHLEEIQAVFFPEVFETIFWSFCFTWAFWQKGIYDSLNILLKLL